MEDKQSLRSNDLKFLKVAKEAALKAGKVISQYSGAKHKFSFKKGDSSNFTTQADFKAEQQIIKILKGYFPDHNLIGEETGIKNGDSEYSWVIDPIDGTVVFAAGLPTFSVSIGLLRAHSPILGVVYQVATGDLYYAQDGQGAYLNGQQIVASKVDDLEKAVIGVDFAHRANRMAKTQQYILPLIDKVRYPVSFGSDALLLSLIGKGSLDGFANASNIWDCVAGALIVVEAGGKFTDLKGGEIDWTQKRIEFIASNGLIHEAILEALNNKN